MDVPFHASPRKTFLGSKTDWYRKLREVAEFHSPRLRRAQVLPHAVDAGWMRNKIFEAQTVIRPSLLLHIVNQGYTALWTDSDMVWLDNPFPFLPHVHDPESVRERV